MTDGFTFAASDDGRRLTVSWSGLEIARFDFAVPTSDAGAPAVDTEGTRIVAGDLAVALTHDDLAGDWRTLLTIDNLGDESVPLPPVGVGITVAAGWSGWTWASDIEGFVVVTPLFDPETPTLLVRLAGFVRAISTVPVFAPFERRPDPTLPAAYSALHLANPTGSLRGSARTRTSLTFSAVSDPEAAGQYLPRWLPNLVRNDDDEIVFDTPDQAVVGGPGVTVDTLGNSALVTAETGHREIAFHDVAGVRRLRASFAPQARDPWLGDLAAGITRTRPSAATSAAALVVVGALGRGVVQDRHHALDWLERVDWLERGDLLALTVAASLARGSHDVALALDATRAAQEFPPGPGQAMTLTTCTSALISAGSGQPGLRVPERRYVAGDDPWSRLECAVFTLEEPTEDLVTIVQAATRRLGGDLPGQPVRLSEAEAGYLIALLNWVPDRWDCREFRGHVSPARDARLRAARLLLTDHASGMQSGHEGLAWLLMAHMET